MSASDNTRKKADLLRAFLEEGKALGIDIPPALFVKLDKAGEDAAKQDKLTVALVGGFSEGKTSIVAAWLGEERPGMKINAGESSDKVETYEAGAHLRIVDTPGLYGHKGGGSLADQIKYKDITRRYISEANIVLYIMNGPNPLKDSHTEELTWLFRELALLPRTVLVLGRFDEVADMEDDAEYDAALETKRQNVTERLSALLGLTDDEAKELSIVGVSGNPYQRGLTHWRGQPEEFAKLSRIDSLKQAIDQKIAALGGRDKVLGATQGTILADVLGQPLRLAEQQRLIMESDLRKLGECVTAAQEDVRRITPRIKQARTTLVRDIDTIFQSTIGAIKASTNETLAAVLEKHLGLGNNVINNQVNEAFAAAIRPVAEDVGKAMRSLEAALGRFSEAQQAGESSLDGRFTIKGEFTPPEKIEDWFRKVPNLVGMGIDAGVFDNIGPLLASWMDTSTKVGEQSLTLWEWFFGGLFGEGAAKVAASRAATEAAASRMTQLLKGAGAVITVGMEALAEHNAQKALAEFKKTQNELCTQLESQRKEIEILVLVPDFSARFLPDFESLKTVFTQVNEELTSKKELFQRCYTWFRHAAELRETL